MTGHYTQAVKDSCVRRGLKRVTELTSQELGDYGNYLASKDIHKRGILIRDASVKSAS